MSEETKLKQIIEAALLAAGGPLNLDGMLEIFTEEERPEKKDLREAMKQLQADYEGRGFELVEVGGGFRINVRAEYAPWVSRLWEERPARYSRALMETLALIAYRQPITRGEIEDIRGVSVSTNIMKTLMERDWVRVVGQRDVPGKPSLYATTKEFLNYFGLKSLDQLPTLQEIRDLDSINRELELEEAVPNMEAANEPGEPEQPDSEVAEMTDDVEGESAGEPGELMESEEETPVSEAEENEEGQEIAEADTEMDIDAITDPETEPESNMAADLSAADQVDAPVEESEEETPVSEAEPNEESQEIAEADAETDIDALTDPETEPASIMVADLSTTDQVDAPVDEFESSETSDMEAGDSDAEDPDKELPDA
ncbi:SMC-Scp complex subunit ScpB [Solemya velesiana gill symbiont]|uniref:SMC-Scp complex subunit ScpB n=1 Tax=Solemya velesiana gill symbiont TaxID=1918948 RepID=A0A1T2KUH7_9GAMM|nr:SMC-Scp complex subunit ScpB [Solemya velesiana gill symbiont]OOZ36484.1 SMC-Scp complex subunit ScpB [Solemya velesiana gill symbiont]